MASEPSELREIAWDLVDRNFCVEQVFGARGADVICRGAARSSVHEFGYSLCLEAALLGCCNGASIAAWPGKATPLSLVVLLANPAQTRKSQISSLMIEVGKAVDASCRQRAQDAGLPLEAGELQSVVLSNFTEAAFFQRTSGGWGQHVSGQRLHFSTLLAIDESYRLLKMLGLTGESSKGSKKDKDAGPCDGASQWNTLLQTGHSNLACKGAQSYESQMCVNVAAVGNLHLGPLISMLRGDMGQHEVASLERILICSARPVAPHSQLPERVALPNTAERLMWVPLLRCMLESLGLPDASLSPQTAREAFSEQSDGTFSIKPADGTETLLRFRPVVTWAMFEHKCLNLFGSCFGWGCLPRT